MRVTAGANLTLGEESRRDGGRQTQLMELKGNVFSSCVTLGIHECTRDAMRLTEKQEEVQVCEIKGWRLEWRKILRRNW